MNVKALQGSNYYSCLSIPSSPSTHRSPRQERRKPGKKSQQVPALYQQMSSQTVARKKFRPCDNDSKYCWICLASEYTIEECPVMPPEVRTALRRREKQNREKACNQARHTLWKETTAVLWSKKSQPLPETKIIKIVATTMTKLPCQVRSQNGRNRDCVSWTRCTGSVDDYDQWLPTDVL